MGSTTTLRFVHCISLSLMPGGRLDPLEPKQITDLFSYLIGL